MYKWISAIVLLAGAGMFAPAHADQRPGCLSTDPGSISWTLPTTPLGPSWSVAADAYSYVTYPVSGRFRFTFWRWPCNVNDSQLILTILPLSDEPILGYFDIHQNESKGRFDRLVVNDPTLISGNELPFSTMTYTSAQPISGIVTKQNGDNFFDPNAEMLVTYTATWPYLNQNVSNRLSIPAYNPAEYGQGSAGFKINSSVTGDWYNKAQSGHGFTVQVLPGDILHIQWYVFSPQGEPLWILGDGLIDGDNATVQGYTTGGPGGYFPPDFDKSGIERKAWGLIRFSFADCMHGTASWQPTVPGFAAGSMPITHLSLPQGLSCP